MTSEDFFDFYTFDFYTFKNYTFESAVVSAHALPPKKYGHIKNSKAVV